MAGYLRITAGWTRRIYHGLLGALETAVARQHGRGVIYGMDLTDGGGLTVNCSAGAINGQAGGIDLDSTSYVLPPSSTVYVWADEGAEPDNLSDPRYPNFTTTVSLSDPGGTYVCLGRVTTGVSTISSIVTTGRMDLNRWTSLWKWVVGGTTLAVDVENNRVGVKTLTPTTDFEVSGTARATIGQFVDQVEVVERVGDPSAPTNKVLLYAKDDGGTALFWRDESSVRQLTEAGRIYLDVPTVSGQQSKSVNVESLSANKTLLITDANWQYLTASGANRDVLMPATAPRGVWFRIINAGASNNLVVKTNDGLTTICTLTPGQMTPEFFPIGGTPAWPTSLTPATEGPV